MQPISKHIIHSLLLELNAGSDDDLDLLNQRLKSVDFEALVDRVLAGYQSLPGTIRIDRLEVDTGWLPLDDDDAFISFLEDQLRIAIDDAISEKLLKWNYMQNENIWRKPLVEDKRVNDWDMVRYYLENGILPWYAPADVDVKGIVRSWIEVQDLYFLEKMRTDRLLPDAYFRLMQLTSYEMLEPLLGSHVDWRITRYLNRVHEPVVRFLRSTRPDMDTQLNESIYPLWLRAVAHSMGFNEFVDLWMKALHRLFSTLSRKHLVQVHKIAMTPFLQKGDVWSENIVEKLYAFFESFAGSLELQESSSNVGPSGKLVWLDSEEAPFTPIEWSKPDPFEGIAHEREDEPDQWYITHAGLVLLNPGLLNRYFEQFGWVQNGCIISDAAGDAMRQWMHYLVWGEQDALEYDFMLGKLLTGCPLEKPVSLQNLLEAKHVDGANELLTTVITHWSRLKLTSIPALRTGFLQRNGILRHDASGWQLHVERKGQDILIDYLPWSYSIIKFPWMEKPLFTQWNTGI